ncbi:hypothetical protein EJ06DRAFT_493942 [Trichodelitschia bisporula]|uniref:non-specific serine/threonine protein kinase n=1 Tax=Trichodelitschia bisporula TaxID=703511 RepID=A0A6G1HWR2_9PEZI|nr:hypothetical protein EJ06DRAFT_493942 [Trichodelitschia bisporula]
MASAPYHNSAIPAPLLPPPTVHHAAVGAQAAPPGTFAPGTKVQVGQHRVIIERYLSEGGFAHVYLVRIPRADSKQDVAVLKRVAVPDKESLANMRTEVETMKKLKGHRRIVTYIDSHASQLKGGGYEVFLLMEYCSGGGLIDYMNTRLQHRLTEPEILHIFADVAEGVACMHYLKPPLLHRDLKVENVLITSAGSARIYKLCDFGSAAPPRPAATSVAEGRLIEDDVQRHTTLQYRSPEMIDVYRKQPINEKSDIWALGVLLYKLCYYTTPFEDQGQMAILNATFKFPSYPSFSDRIKKFITSMLREQPQLRPNIYQVVREVCSMRGTEVPIKDIYANRTESESHQYEKLPSPDPSLPVPGVVGIQKVTSVHAPQPFIPEITPMRRGRPTAQTLAQPSAAKRTPAGSRGTSSDPFAALDSTNPSTRAVAVDELSARFPSLDEFTLLHDKGAKFEFDSAPAADPKQEQLNKRVAEVLADQAFAQARLKSDDAVSVARTEPATVHTPALGKPAATDLHLLQGSRSQPSLLYEPTPQRPVMVSTGIQTSPPPSPPATSVPEKSRPVWRVPSSKTANSTVIEVPPVPARELELPPRPEATSSRPKILDRHRTKSQTMTLSLPKSPSSSRPSLEGRRPSALDLSDPIGRSKSANARPRPSSVYVESNLDYLRDRETTKGRNSSGLGIKAEPLRSKTEAPYESSDEGGPEEPVISTAEYRSPELPEDVGKRKSRRSGSGSKSKRTSLPAMSLSNTKNILAGKFGEAFRRFETNTGGGQEPDTYSEEPLHSGPALTPIAGSEATGTSSRSDDEHAETEDLPPEMRRELERRRLIQEEKRVAAAAADYKKRLEQGDRPGTASSKASTIQNRVKTLLDNKNEAPVVKTAEGYGRFTDATKIGDRPAVARKPVAISAAACGIDRTRQSASTPLPQVQPPVSNLAAAGPSINRTGNRPNVAPKPRALRTGNGPLEGMPGRQQEDEDWEATFSKKYPSLSGLELVEADIPPAAKQSTGMGMRIRDV